MDKSVLIEYEDMKEEIKDLRRRIELNRRRIGELERTLVIDSVACGRKGKKPLRTVRITGFPDMEIGKQKAALERMNAKLTMMETDLLELSMQVEEYIESIDRSELRTMFRLYYLDGLTWVQVAHRMNTMFPRRRIKYTDDNCRKRNERYFEKV